jgi:biopolymer transport protein ExbD
MKLKTKITVTPSFEMSSMTDLVFLLLIFFMLITTLIVPNVNALKLTLPSSTTAEKRKDLTVSVSINQKSEYFLNNQLVSETQLFPAIQGFLSDKKNPTIILHAQKSVPVESVVRVLDIANKLKVKLVLATHPEK